MKCQRCGKDAVTFTSDESTFGGLTRGTQVAWCKDCYDEHKANQGKGLTLKLIVIGGFVLAVAVACGILLN